MPKRKAKGRSAGSHGQKKRTERAAKAAARRERKSGLYLSPGDADFKKLSDQLKLQGLALRDVPGDGCVIVSRTKTALYSLWLSDGQGNFTILFPFSGTAFSEHLQHS